MIFDSNEYCDEEFKTLDLSNENISTVDFDNCNFKNCIFTELTLDYCKFVDCTFEDCDLSLMKIKYSVFNDVLIKNSKAIGIDWSLSESPFSINIYNSTISMSSFYKLDLKLSNIIGCIAHEVDFVQTNLEKAVFKETDLLNSTFDDTNLKYTDLSQAINYTINPNLNTLKSTKVSLSEATSFLQFLDIKIVE